MVTTERLSLSLAQRLTRLVPKARAATGLS